MLVGIGRIVLPLMAGLALAAGVSARDAVPVQVGTLGDMLVALERKAPADVRPLNRSVLAAEVPAVVSEIVARVGQQVSSGDVLLELEATDWELNLQQAVASLESSKAQKAQADAKLQRARELVENQYLSADELLARETDVMVMAAQIQANEVSVAIARRNLEKCTVRAPFDAVVTERFAQEGGFVTNGSPLLSLTELDRFELDSEIAAAIAPSIELAGAIRFETETGSYPVNLLRLSPAVDVDTRTRRARFGFPGPAPAIGSSGVVVWEVEKGLLPSSLVVRRSGLLGIFSVDGGAARFIPLPKAQEGRPVPVTLPLETPIVLRGRDRLQDGDPVEATR